MTWRTLGVFLLTFLVYSVALIVTQLIYGKPFNSNLFVVAVPAGLFLGCFIAYRDRREQRRKAATPRLPELQGTDKAKAASG